MLSFRAGKPSRPLPQTTTALHFERRLASQHGLFSRSHDSRFLKVNRSFMKKNGHSEQPLSHRWLDVDEVRLVSDLRIMHSKVDELYQIVVNLKRRHSETDIQKYADQPVLNEDIARMDETYLWFVNLKEQHRSKKAI